MRAAKRDYYEALGVERSADGAALKAAYRKLAVKYHPDHNQDNPDAEEAFKEITEAYAVLSDADRRRRYDQLGHAAFAGEDGSGPDFSSFGDILEGLFDGVFGNRATDRLPKDLRYNLEIGFEEAALGADKRIEYERREVCGQCNGSRADPGASHAECSACSGRGEVRFQRGFFANTRLCSQCSGTGVRAEARCKRCEGRGSEARKRVLTVKLPAGVEDGAVRSVSDAGEQTLDGSGALHVHVAVRPHPLFTREGADVLCEVPVSFPQAALGAQIDVPTLEGRVSMRLPPGTQSGKVFRLRGKGLPVFGGYGKGDQFVTVVVEVPQQLNERQRALLAKLADELDSGQHLPAKHGFLDKLKNLFD